MILFRHIQVLIFVFLSILLILTGCVGNVPMIVSGVSGEKGLPPEEASFTKFNDLPMSSSSRMNVEKSLIFGSDSEWFGRINLLVDLSAAQIFDFYRFEMPNFGWKEITSIRSDVSLLTYDRGGRVANIRITRTKVSGAEVWITVSPKRDTSGSVK